ncbi:MAG: DNA topoisomerase [Phycisphaeraceae bacterium]|nr:DNA topoisomerase [Phycisphaeraceae bacterium]
MAKRKTKVEDRTLFEDIVPDGADNGQRITLQDAARTRYLNYALSVITSRALPDVRDGLKPVQRRILYTMWQQRLTHDAKHRKSAKVVGDVMGSYHPHGDTAIYDALVRMAQPFSLRVPLIDPSGNFGSLDGDAPAAMRYTECRLAAVADEILREIGQRTVPFRPNYDGTRSEPVVLPARLPNLLINGATGIAVGMATNIPPHNPAEVCTALLKLLDDPELMTHHLCKYVKGPDFPTGAQILSTPEELKKIYQEGTGAVRVRATWEKGAAKRGTKFIYITSVPYTVNKSNLVERIAEVALARKLPPLLDVRDVSTDDVRIELELKKDADEQKVMAYLFRHTPLQINFNVNMTCLVPTENPMVGRPHRSDLREILWNFLRFRLDVVTRRLEHELEALQRRIHVLEGFVKVFDALDQILRIIRGSDGKADAAGKIMKRFDLDAEQTDAILELKLYRLAKLEVLVIRDELKDKQKRARTIGRLLKNEEGRWAIVGKEIEQIRADHAKNEPRRTKIQAASDEPQFSSEDFIVDEVNHVLVTADGWVKRQKEIRDPSSTRLREGDRVLAVLAGSTRATCVFFSNFGTAYTCRIIDIPATTGHGQPIQKHFKLKDRERILAAIGLDPRTIGDIQSPDEDHAPPSHAIAVTSDGYALRFGYESFLEPSTRSGRRFARLTGQAEVVGVAGITGHETLIAISRAARAMLCPAVQVNYLSGPGRGVKLIRLDKDDRILGFKASTGDRDLLEVVTSQDSKRTVSTAKYEVTSRGGKGRTIMQRGSISRIVPEPVEAVTLDDE